MIPAETRLILHPDVQVVPAAELNPRTRARAGLGEGEVVLIRPNARDREKVLDADAYRMVRQFDGRRTFIEGVAAYCVETGANAEDAFEDADSLLEGLIAQQFLVDGASESVESIRSTYEPGDEVRGCTIRRCVQLLADSEVYEVVTETGRAAALKIARDGLPPEAAQMFGQEARLLSALWSAEAESRPYPELLDCGFESGRPFQLLEWLRGDGLVVAVTHASTSRKIRACRSMLAAYSALHRQGVLHGDVHPGNVIVDDEGAAKLIDFGHARRINSDEAGKRGAVLQFLEPEVAGCFHSGDPLPPATIPGEQYSLAAMLFLTLSGQHYLDFPLIKDSVADLVLQGAPRRFAEVGGPNLPTVEAVIRRALSKDPDARFESVSEFLGAFDQVCATDLERLVSNESLPDPVEHAVAQYGFDSAKFRFGPPIPPTGSVAGGAAGVAYALYRMGRARGSARILALAEAWAAKAVGEKNAPDAFRSDAFKVPANVGSSSPYHFESGCHLVRGLIAAEMGDREEFVTAAHAFVDSSAMGVKANRELDLFLGKSGTILGAAFLLEAGAESSMRVSLVNLGTQTEAEVWTVLDRFAPIGEGKEMPNLGIAHGWGGLCYSSILWSIVTGRPVREAVVQRLGELRYQAESDAAGDRWPWQGGTAPHARSIFMPGWCNGSAGMTLLWASAYKSLGDPIWLEMAVRSARNAWADPARVANLCCGFAGRAYAMLSVYNLTGEAVWLERAKDLALAAWKSRDQEPSPGMGRLDDSLYNGELGIALLLAELDDSVNARMPLFELESW